MNELERRTLLGAAGIGALAAMSKAGPLNPPAGSVAPTGRTLDEIYNKIPIPGAPPTGAYEGRTPIPGGTSPYTISQPGSYVLTGNLSAAGLSADAITINASGVTLDLNGFNLTGGNGNRAGVSILDGVTHTVVRNGRISGAQNGVMIAAASSGHLIEDLLIRSPFSTGVFSNARCTVVRRCVITEIGGGFASSLGTGVIVRGDCSTVEECIVERFFTTHPAPSFNGVESGGIGNAINRCVISNPTMIPGVGLLMTGNPTIYRDNAVMNVQNKYITTGGAINVGQNA